MLQCNTNNNDERLDSTTNNCSSSSCSQGYRSKTTKKGDRKTEFFIHYKNHSEQLVTALKKWGQQLNLRRVNMNMVS
jgi:hypothetical protein